MSGVLVFVDEEYGYRQWAWHTGMTREEVITWWTALESVKPYFFSPAGLPGKVVPLYDVKEGFAENIEDKDKDCYPGIPIGEVVSIEAVRAGLQLHLHMDDDSVLYCADTKERWTHKGYIRKLVEMLEA